MGVQLIDGQFAWPIAGEERQKLQSQLLLAIWAINAEMLPKSRETDYGRWTGEWGKWRSRKCLALSSPF